MVVFIKVFCLFLALFVCLTWSKTAFVVDNGNGGFVVVDSEPANGKYVAGANFTNSINQTGWAELEVWTIGDYSDSFQVKAAGLIEGFLTTELVYMSYVNTLQGYCGGREEFCDKVRHFLAVNRKWAKKMYKRLRSSDPFWHQVALFYEQLEGFGEGLRQGASAAGLEVPDEIPMWMNVAGDLEELEQIFNGASSHHVLGSGSCSALIKVLPDNSDILTSHVTWNGYSSMIRILKKYTFQVRQTADDESSLVPGYSASFSSYPGVLYSADDFTVLSSGLVAMETTIGNSNADLWKYIQPSGQVLEGVRSVAANRLATSGKQWAQVFKRHNSGTYNNQWMIVDYKLFKRGQSLKDGLLWVLEQLPSYVESHDMTDTLRKQSYWPSYNCPAFKTVYNMSGNGALVDKYGDWFTYEKTPRALIFQRDHSSVTDKDSMVRLMRYNDYQNDPLSGCDQCQPPYSSENTISARNDLNPADGTYPFPALGHRSHGATDCKMTSLQMMASLDFLAVSGPTRDPLPPFQWSKSDLTDSHYGHPDEWIFDPITTRWFH